MNFPLPRVWRNSGRTTPSLRRNKRAATRNNRNPAEHHISLAEKCSDNRSQRIETDHVLDILGGFGIIGALERAQKTRLEPMGFPQTLDCAERDADGLSHRAARPMGGFVRRFRKNERQHLATTPVESGALPGVRVL